MNIRYPSLRAGCYRLLLSVALHPSIFRSQLPGPVCHLISSMIPDYEECQRVLLVHPSRVLNHRSHLCICHFVCSFARSRCLALPKLLQVPSKCWLMRFQVFTVPLSCLFSALVGRYADSSLSHCFACETWILLTFRVSSVAYSSALADHVRYGLLPGYSALRCFLLKATCLLPIFDGHRRLRPD